MAQQIAVGGSWEANPGTLRDLSSRKRKSGMLLVETSEAQLSGCNMSTLQLLWGG